MLPTVAMVLHKGRDDAPKGKTPPVAMVLPTVAMVLQSRCGTPEGRDGAPEGVWFLEK